MLDTLDFSGSEHPPTLFVLHLLAYFLINVFIYLFNYLFIYLVIGCKSVCCQLEVV